jgi:O-antigen/teichoic acid export membrane protein
LGVIARQSLKASAVNYAGAFIGILNTFFLFTLCFDESELGQIRYIQEIAILSGNFASLGIFNVVIRFFPEFKTDDNKNRGILSFAIVVLLLGLVILGFILFRYDSFLPQNIIDNAPLIFVIAVAVVFGSLCFNYSSNFGLVTIPSLLKNLYVKIGLAVFGLAYFYVLIDFTQVLNSLAIVYATSTLLLVLYLFRKGNFKLSSDFSFFTKQRLKKIGTFAGFGILGTLGSSLANKIDIFMVTDLLNYTRTGVYTIALNASNLLMIPTAGIMAVAGPVIVSALKKNDLYEVEQIYKKAGINLFLFGSLILLLLWCNIDSVFELIPNGEKYASGKIVVLILGGAKLFDMLTSVNELIISYSKYFKFNLYALLILAVLNIIANVILIPQFDIAGAALATLMSVVSYNIGKAIFIYIKFRIHPFQVKLLIIMGVSLMLYGVNLLLPQISNPFLSILFKSVFLGVSFVFFVIYWNISEEATKLWQQAKSKLQAIFDK